ncbi:MAG TPA: nickel pincer cofactor biosynthesis protein LarC [Abditibacteriaceae bacterium]|jgi:hypothetical protein
MTIAYLDCFAGIAGDMTLAALLDCGVPLEALRAGLSSLPVQGWDITAQPVLKSGIHGTSVSISLHGVTDAQELEATHARSAHADHVHAHSGDHHEHAHEHGHAHTGEYSHEHHAHDSNGHSHPEHEHNHEHHAHAHSDHHSHHHGRSMREIHDIIEGSGLSERVKQNSLAVFESIARVEAQMHHSTPEDVHFHEIGGVDSLIDICGVAWCLEYLGVQEVYCSALPYSTGYVDCAHGRMPVPAPATLELLKGAPMIPTEIRGEMITPTGAGIVAALAKGFGAPPAMTVQQVGAGAGKKDWPDRPNLLRVVIGEQSHTGQPQPTASIDAQTTSTHTAPQGQSTENSGLQWQTMSLVETNIDDMNPELWDFVFAQVFEAGAVDVWLQPVQMKKNRPASLLGALCESGKQEAVVAALLRETTTLGVRVSTVRRAALPREMREVQTPWGNVRVKVARWPEHGLVRAAPEYEDVKRLANEHGVAAREIYAAAMHAAHGLK